MSKKAGLPEIVRMRHDYHLVDEISRRTKTPIIRNIPLDKLVPNELQPRKEMGELGEMADSIREKGILEPLIVKPKDGHFEIIAGERRFRAAQLAGLKEVPCIEHDVPDNEALELSIIENIQRKDLDVYEEAYSLKMLGDIYGYTHQEIAQKLGKSRVTVTELIRVSDLPKEVVEKARELGIHSKTFLLELVKLENPEKMMRVLADYRENSFSRDEVKRQRQEEAAKPEDATAGGKGPAKYQPPLRFQFVSENKAIRIHFNIRKEESLDRDTLIQTLEQLLDDIRENRISELHF
jgi:ParB family transcriptional regulator, chromosome partitioning protein